MSDAEVKWQVQLPKGIQRMFKKQPCQAKLTMRTWGTRRFIKGYLVMPAQEGVRINDAYQLIVTLEFEEYHAWGLDRQVEQAELAARYMRIAEVKFGLTITKITFRGEEVKECG